MILVQDQFVLIQPDVGKQTESESEVKNTTMRVLFGAVHEIYDDTYIIIQDNGAFFVLQTPIETGLIVPIFEDGEPALVQKTFTGKYKFPKAKVAK